MLSIRRITLNYKICIICKNKFEAWNKTQTICSKPCRIERTKIYQKRYFSIPKNHQRQKKQMREYMKRPDVIKREIIRKKSKKYKDWQKRYLLTDEYREAQKRSRQKLKDERLKNKRLRAKKLRHKR